MDQYQELSRECLWFPAWDNYATTFDIPSLTENRHVILLLDYEIDKEEPDKPAAKYYATSPGECAKHTKIHYIRLVEGHGHYLFPETETEYDYLREYSLKACMYLDRILKPWERDGKLALYRDSISKFKHWALQKSMQNYDMLIELMLMDPALHTLRDKSPECELENLHLVRLSKFEYVRYQPHRIQIEQVIVPGETSYYDAHKS